MPSRKESSEATGEQSAVSTEHVRVWTNTGYDFMTARH
jgi:hypothetical protein